MDISGGINVKSFKTTNNGCVIGDDGTLIVNGILTGRGLNIVATAGSSTAIASINSEGRFTGVSYNATSDIRLKTNIQQMPSQWENIKSLNPSEYTWIDSSKYDCGFIAQEVYAIYPHLRPTLGNVIINENDNPVTPDGNPVYYTIDYGKMTPYLCKGLQEVMSETDTLKLEIAELKQQIQSLRELVMNK